LTQGPFTWNSAQQGVVLGAFFYGYIATQILGGILADKYGAKYLILFGVAWTSVLTLITPICTNEGGYVAIVIVRILEGLGEVSRQTLYTSVVFRGDKR
jgi:ACS family sodium-dependent inorganic phosphate cotransporter-like MFS transporter 5